MVGFFPPFRPLDIPPPPLCPTLCSKWSEVDYSGLHHAIFLWSHSSTILRFIFSMDIKELLCTPGMGHINLLACFAEIDSHCQHELQPHCSASNTPVSGSGFAHFEY